MIEIRVKDTESIDRALRRFKKKFDKTGVMREVRGRMYYQKPSAVKKEQMKRAVNRQRYMQEEM